MSAHFNRGSDYFRYRGRILRNQEKEKFGDSKYYTICAKIVRNKTRQEIVETILANVFDNKITWVGDISDDAWVEWKKRQDSLSYRFLKEFDASISKGISINKIFKSIDGEYPALIASYIQGKISAESIIVLDYVFDFLDRYSKEYENDIFLSNKLTTLQRYRPFIVRYHAISENKKRYQRMVKNKIEENLNVLPF